MRRNLTRTTLATCLALGAVALGAAAAVPAQRDASSATVVAGGCWNKPYLPDWCEPPDPYRPPH